MRADGTTGKRVKYLEIKLKHVIVSSVTPSVLSEGLPTETFGLKYAAVTWLYTQQGIDGKNKAGKPASWSLSKNNATYTA